MEVNIFPTSIFMFHVFMQIYNKYISHFTSPIKKRFRKLNYVNQVKSILNYIEQRPNIYVCLCVCVCVCVCDLTR
jgi:hypothetical protein